MDIGERQAFFNRAMMANSQKDADRIGLSKEDVASILGITPRDLEAYLRGDCQIPDRVINRTQILSGVSKALTVAFPEIDKASQWLRMRGSVPTADVSPMEMLCSNSDEAALQVLTYLKSLENRQHPTPKRKLHS